MQLRLPRSITVKVTLVLVAVALVSVAIVAVVANYTINTRFNDYMQEGPPSFIVNPDGTLTKVTAEDGMSSQSMSGLMRHIMGGPEERFLEAVNQSLWIAAIVVIFVAGLTSVLFARRLTSPIKHVTSAAKEIAAGRLDHRIAVKSKDEIGELAGTFNNMAASLDKNQRLNRQLLAGIAHELRTPLTIIQGNLEAILDGVQEATPEKIAALHTETVLVNRLVNDLRELTLAEAGQLRLATQEVDLKALALNVTEMLQPMLSEKAIKLTVKMPDSLPGASADPDRVTQVLYNLLTNAIRHTGAKGKIDISAAKLDNMVSVSVKDNGEGIPKDELSLIFDHFYRVDEARARATGGTGMGLAITRLLVEAHGGNIFVTSSPDKGTEFTFTLPISY